MTLSVSPTLSDATREMTTSPPKSDATLENLSTHSLSELLPSPSERALFVGRTGSGKTTLSEQLLRDVQFAAVLDMKHRLHWQGYERHERLNTLMQSQHSHLIYAPSWEEMRYDTKRERWSKFVEEFFRWVVERNNTTVYIDEVMRCTRGDHMPEYYHAAVTLGRELYVSVWSATQRPTKIPQVLLSETERFYIFDLQLSQDVEKMEDTIGANLPSRKGHEFVYMKNDEQSPRKFVLIP